MSPTCHTKVTCSRRARRRIATGISLVETLAVMSATAAIVATAIAVLVSIGRIDRDSAGRLEQRRAMAQLTDRIREDVHAARDLEWEEDKRTLRLTTADGKVINYRGEDNAWIRSVTEDGKDSLTAAFRLPLELRVTVKPSDAGVSELVRIIYGAQKSPPNVRPIEIALTVGRDERLLHE